MSDTQLRAQHVADQSNARVLVALEAAFSAVRSGRWALIQEALTAYGAASWEAGWDQAHADLRDIVLRHTGADIGPGGA